MRRDPDGAFVLSKRNLLTLLGKLERPESQRTLYGPMFNFTVRAEPDSVHYAHESREGQPPGPVHSAEETFIKEYK
jgi:hypothetical protein